MQKRQKQVWLLEMLNKRKKNDSTGTIIAALEKYGEGAVQKMDIMDGETCDRDKNWRSTFTATKKLARRKNHILRKTRLLDPLPPVQSVAKMIRCGGLLFCMSISSRLWSFCAAMTEQHQSLVGTDECEGSNCCSREESLAGAFMGCRSRMLIDLLKKSSRMMNMKLNLRMSTREE